MDCQGERSASIHLFELTRSAVETIEFLNFLGSYFERRLVSINPLKSILAVIEDVYSFYYFAGVLFEQKDEELVLARLKDVYQFLSLFSIQLSWETDVGYRVYHQFLIRLLCK